MRYIAVMIDHLVCVHFVSYTAYFRAVEDAIYVVGRSVGFNTDPR